MTDNEIIVLINSDNSAELQFQKCKIVTPAFIGKNGYTNNKQEGDGCTPIGEFSLGLMLGTHEEILNKNYDYAKINSNMYG